MYAVMHIYWLIPDFYSPFPIYEESRFFPTGWTPLHLVPQFSSIAFWRGELHFVWKNFSLTITYQPHALLLNFVHPESHNDRKPKVTYRLNGYLFIAFDFSIHKAALLPWSITARELHAVTHVHSSSRPQQHNWSPNDLTHPNVVAAGLRGR